MDALDKFFNGGSYSGYAEHSILASAHGNINVMDPMSSDASHAIMNAFPTAFYGLPGLMFDLNNSMYLSSNATAPLIASKVSISLDKDAATAISASVTGTEGEGTVNVKAKVKIGETGSY